jgi:hypothetical protein
MTDTAESLNRELHGFTDVISLHLLFDGQVGYDLKLVLENQKHVRRQLFCRDVSLLQMAEFGGGLSQISGLRVEDVRSRHLDRIKLEFNDLSPERLSFSCATAEITNAATEF